MEQTNTIESTSRSGLVSNWNIVGGQYDHMASSELSIITVIRPDSQGDPINQILDCLSHLIHANLTNTSHDTPVNTNDFSRNPSSNTFIEEIPSSSECSQEDTTNRILDWLSHADEAINTFDEATINTNDFGGNVQVSPSTRSDSNSSRACTVDKQVQELYADEDSDDEEWDLMDAHSNTNECKRLKYTHSSYTSPNYSYGSGSPNYSYGSRSPNYSSGSESPNYSCSSSSPTSSSSSTITSPEHSPVLPGSNTTSPGYRPPPSSSSGQVSQSVGVGDRRIHRNVRRRLVF